MGSSRFFVFELGSTSLKFHFQGSHGVQTVKVPWQIAYEICETDRISRQSTDQAATDIQTLLNQFGNGCDEGKVIAFATGVFREAENILDFLFEIRSRTGVKIRVISDEDEAALLQALFLSQDPDADSFVFDLGSGSLQWVHVSAFNRCQRGSLPVGVIRFLQMASGRRDGYLPCDPSRLAADRLGAIPAFRPSRLAGTGGTVRAIARLVGSRTVSLKAIEDLEEQVRRNGVPASLKPHRVPLVLPGLILVHALMLHLEARELHYVDLSVGTAVLQKLLPFYAVAAPQRPTEVWRRLHFSQVIGPRRNAASSSRAGPPGA